MTKFISLNSAAGLLVRCSISTNRLEQFLKGNKCRSLYYMRNFLTLALVFGLLGVGVARSKVLNADFNGDLREDLAVGIPYENVRNVSDAGAVAIYYWKDGGIPASPSVILHEDTPGVGDSPGVIGRADVVDNFGKAIATGDFNRDGFHDLAIGVPRESLRAGLYIGGVHVFYGSRFGLRLDGAQYLFTNQLGSSFHKPNENFGYALVADDFNGDGYDDLYAGIPGWSSNRGGVVGFRGSYKGLETRPYDFVGGPFLEARYGDVLESGDLDLDGYADLVVGVWQADTYGKTDAGLVQVLYGSPTGIDRTRFQGLADVKSNGGVELGDHFGKSLAIGKFNRDDYPDLAVGHPGENQRAGMVTIFYGSRLKKFDPAWTSSWSQNSPGVPEDDEIADAFGFSLATADFNGDRRHDLAIGIPRKDDDWYFWKSNDVGSVVILYQGSSGLYANETSGWHQDRHSVKSSRDEYDRFGEALSVGHFNNDDIADLIVGVPGEDVDNGIHRNAAGMFHIFYGAQGVGLSSAPALGREIFTQGRGNDTYGGRAEAGDEFGKVFP